MSRNEIIIGVFALVLVLFSLVVSLVIPRRDPRFPGRYLRFFVLVAALLVAGMLTAVEVFGEAHHAAEGKAEATEAGGGNAEAGKKVFTSAGCNSCHTLSAAGATGNVGPNLDEVLKGKDAAFVHESIVDPNAEIAKGFSQGVMPQDFAEKLSDADIANLVAFLLQATGGGPEGKPEAGKQVFTSAGCTSCHTLSAAGSTATVGPNLDEVLKGKDAAFIRESIVNPDAKVAQGYSKDLMPETFGEQLSDAQLANLVAFLVQATSG